MVFAIGCLAGGFMSVGTIMGIKVISDSYNGQEEK